MPFNSVAQVADAVEQGRSHIQHFLRTGFNGSFGVSNVFGDASIGSGVPNYNAYLGNALEATQMIGTGNRSIYVGPGISTERYLLSLSLTMAGSVGYFSTTYFLDYLLSYAYVDLDSTDEQLLENPVTLPRYASGEGVRMIAVMQTPGTGLGATMTVKYTNSDGVAGRTVVMGARSSGAIGVNIVGQDAPVTATGPFAPMADGDRGVRAIESVQLNGGIGGFAVIALVKPLTTLAANELLSTVEKNFLREHANLPRIYDGAFLNYLFNLAINTSTLAPVIGQAQFVWTE